MKHFTDHYEKNRTRLHRRLTRATGCHFAGEDVLHSAYESAFRTYSSRKDGEIDAWFETIVRRCMADFLREKYNRPNEEELDEYDFQGGHSLGEEEKMFREVLRVIRDFKPDQREVLYYYVKNDYTVAEIVELTDYTLSGVKSIVYRFHEHMREYYGRE